MLKCIVDKSLSPAFDPQGFYVYVLEAGTPGYRYEVNPPVVVERGAGGEEEKGGGGT